ncbi:tyrosine-type recombinase/integrase [Paenibacillus sp. NRS-1760]|uniref:tyrosine-type recombinase/integrase n=1 Tax=Paenibacillus sp. NRS-1760 TaxID=3233902 RepID=UPI003D2681EE
MTNNILLDSHYYSFWYAHVELRESTKKSQTSILKRFGEYIQSKDGERELDFEHFFYDRQGNTEPIDEDFFDEYFTHLLNSGKSEQSMYSTISCLKNFMQFLSDNNMVRKNCVKYYKNPYYKLRRQDKSLISEECNILLASALKEGLMYYTLVLLMLRCGLRAQEVCQLKFINVQLDSSLIYVVEGQKTTSDTVFIHPMLGAALKKYLASEEWHRWHAQGGKYLFYQNGTAMSPRVLSDILAEISTNAGIRLVKPHDLRHTMPNLMYEEGASIQTIQRQMRHSRLETTLHYMSPKYHELFCEDRLFG